MKIPVVSTGDKVIDTANTSLKEMLNFSEVSENKDVNFLPSKFIYS